MFLVRTKGPLGLRTVLSDFDYLFFSYFYASLIVNPVDMSQNLKKMGASIPGIRPGQKTSDYVEKVLNRLTFLGAIFLGLVAIVPTAVESAIGVQTFRGFGATSLLILVGVRSKLLSKFKLTSSPRDMKEW